ncbi:MAG: histidine phosphatase family protein [Proteobacteria bacterium]|nr:histidine phosphatase family protein [Pseudomonadota bacterium]
MATFRTTISPIAHTLEILTRLCIIRHGETDWNAEKRIQGHLDIPLNESGLRQAHAIADGLAECPFRNIYSSDLRRAWQTAKIAAGRLEIPLRPHEGLRERHSGVLEGRTVEELSARHPEAHARFLDRDPDYPFGPGESMRTFSARVVAAVEELVASHAGETLLLVTHGGVLDVVFRIATGRSLDAPRDYPMPNAGINWFEHSSSASRKFRLVAWGEQYHLDPSLHSGSDHPE